MSQNTSSAVMQQRKEPHDSLDFFPTPAWATRALIEHVLVGGGWSLQTFKTMSCWEPACGEGHMARPLGEYFKTVEASDVHPYGFGAVRDFLMPGNDPRVDMVITNPPFKLAREFIERGLQVSRHGTAVLVRSAFLEGIDRYLTLFRERQPTILAPFVERVPMFKGRVDPRGSTATAYCWLVWLHNDPLRGATSVRWIPPCRKQLEREGDYP